MKSMQKAIGHLLYTLFDIREGEVRRVVLMQFNIFLIICTLLIVKPSVYGLFLAKFGAESLPRAYVLVAFFAGFISMVYSRALNRASLLKIITNTLLGSVLTLVVFGFFLRLNFLEGWVLYLFYLWVAVFGVLSASQFWVLANLIFNAREAKRLYGFIGAGAIAGGIFGGYLTSILTQITSSENLLFVGAFLLSLCIPISRSIYRRDVAESSTPALQQERRIRKEHINPFRLVRSSRHLSLLAGIVLISVAVAKLVEYQFSDLASSSIPDPDQLTAFFGFWYSTFNVVSLFIQLFLTRRLVGTLGVGTSLFFLPGAIFVAASLLIFVPELWVVILLRMADGSLKQSINKAAIELLILPIAPEIKNQAKTFIDVFIDSLATGLSGLILIFIVSGLDLPSQAISIMICLLISTWIWLAWQIRKEYLRTFRLKLEGRKNKQQSKAFNLNQTSAIQGFRRVLKSGSEAQQIFILQKIRELKDDRFFADVRALLQHPSPEIQAEAIHCLYFFKKHTLLSEIKPLTRDASQKVRIKAFEYLIEHAPGQQTEWLEKYLAEVDYQVQLAALISLAFETKDNPILKQRFRLEERLENLQQRILAVPDPEKQQLMKLGLLKAVGFANLPKYYSYIRHGFNDQDPKIVHQAILSAGATLHLDFLPELINFLEKKEYREITQEALAGFGTQSFDLLSNILDESESLEIQRAIPALISRIGTQESVAFLFRIFDHSDQIVRIETLRALNDLKAQHPHLYFDKKKVLEILLSEVQLYSDTLSILYSQTTTQDKADDTLHFSEAIQEARKKLSLLLEKRLDYNLERIFRLLGLNYPPDDILSIYENFQSKQSDLRINAVEFLDNLLQPNLRKVIMPIVETAMLETISEKAVKALNLKVLHEYDCFSMILEGKDTRIKLAVLHIIAQSNDRKYIPLLEACLQSKVQSIREYARQNLEKLDRSG